MIGAIIQARIKSTRLHGKILKTLPFNTNNTVLDNVIERVKQSKLINKIVIATTTDVADNPIINIAENQNVSYFRGDETDVLSRYYHSAKENNIDVVIRITSDCPCLDPKLLDMMIDKFLENNVDYIRFDQEFDYPRGYDIEVLSIESLEKVYHEAKEKYEREHVTPYFYLTNKFKIMKVKAEPKYIRSDIRVTLDTLEDYYVLCSLYDSLYDKNKFFGIDDVISECDAKPWIPFLNSKIIQKQVNIKTRKEEIKEAIKVLTLQELHQSANILQQEL